MINSDSEFKAALSNLSSAGQRRLAAQFVQNVLALCKDDRVKGAINSAGRTDITDDEFAAAFQLARAASVDSFTRCGQACDWSNQAGHFVAESALACFKPAEPGGNAAWDAAMHARMARTCESIANGVGTDNAEVAAQYHILAKFLKA